MFFNALNLSESEKISLRCKNHDAVPGGVPFYLGGALVNLMDFSSLLFERSLANVQVCHLGVVLREHFLFPPLRLVQISIQLGGQTNVWFRRKLLRGGFVFALRSFDVGCREDLWMLLHVF